ncbi:hypothetical protein DPMN_106023 [Dreissena polymorpha]|uniref:C2H2-type domain-containing protein n=1 Tax=Dreissena polymorpha TaxID=45954 RepID=A0A9D4K4C8_DREPO|nr:hypothetical protein DPMN_106023 [Dreissena polymorpha]
MKVQTEDKQPASVDIKRSRTKDITIKSNYTCDSCTYYTMYKCNLQRHQKIHSNSREDRTEHRQLYVYETCDLFVLIGKIMVHAIVLEGYFPIRLCKAAMITINAVSCSAEVVMSSFLSYVSASQRTFIQKVTQNDPLSCEENLVLFKIFNYFCMTRTPDRQKYRDCVYKVAEMSCIYRSLRAMGKICQGIKVYPGLWTILKESDINELCDQRYLEYLVELSTSLATIALHCVELKKVSRGIGRYS